MPSSFHRFTLRPNTQLGPNNAIILTQSKHYQITSTAKRESEEPKSSSHRTIPKRRDSIWGNGTEPGMPGPCLILRIWMEHG
ncbi:hypothetical protein V1478_000844 [Vespula squamosa]|uniref:Uncharacterized protein n=1 Tax=Vespula squamosa TaxID=30214 RepID=A0ABD2C8Q9_VESSQ